MKQEKDKNKSKVELLLEELLRWNKFTALRNFIVLAENELKSDLTKKIYELSDGRHSTNQIAKEVGTTNATVYNYWKRWLKQGLVIPSNHYAGRFERVCSLKEVGLL